MHLTDLNSNGGIGANSHFVRIGPFHIVVDAGLNPKIDGREAMPRLDYLSSHKIDLICLTHCHLDHLGALPVLARQHPAADILMSQPSQILAPRMLHNSSNVMGRLREEKQIFDYPLYTHGEVERLRKRILALPFDRPLHFTRHGEELTVVFYRAGHVAGAAGIEFIYKHRRIFFSGDVLFTDQATLPGARFPTAELDTIILETTRGARGRDPQTTRQSEVERLLQTIADTLKRGASVLIPVFALGRMQELTAILHDACRQHRLPKARIFCSGLGIDLADYYDEIARKTGQVHFRRDFLKDLKISPLPPLRPHRDPAPGSIYLLSSGMMVENTPSYAAALSLLGDPSNTVCFVGYCDPETPGGRLLTARPGDVIEFTELSEETERNATVERFDLSGHADREELLQFAVNANPRAVVLNHGDPEARAWFEESFATGFPAVNVVNPAPLTETLI